MPRARTSEEARGRAFQRAEREECNIDCNTLNAIFCFSDTCRVYHCGRHGRKGRDRRICRRRLDTDSFAEQLLANVCVEEDAIFSLAGVTRITREKDSVQPSY